MSIPWQDVTLNPHCYYDTWAHTFPCRLVVPQEMDEITLTHTAVYLANKSPSAPPFAFFDKAELGKNLELIHAMDANSETHSPNSARSNLPLETHNLEPQWPPGPPGPPQPPSPVPATLPLAELSSPVHMLGPIPHPPSNTLPAALPVTEFGSPVYMSKPASQPPPNTLNSHSVEINEATSSQNSVSELTVAAENPSKTATKRKRGRPSKSETVGRPGSSRIRKAPAAGPVLVNNPALPPPKRVKPSWEYVPVVDT